MDDRRSTMQAPLMAAALLALLLIAYVSGFYLLGRIGTVGAVRFHIYKSQWLSVVFTPAAQAESMILGREVYAAYTEEP
jgi:ABC-type molybdate transport system permease subunit